MQVANLQRGQLGIAVTRLDQRQRDRPIQQVGTLRLAGALGRTRDIQYVIEELKGEADLLTKGSQRIDWALPFDCPQLARRAEEHRCLQPAAL